MPKAQCPQCGKPASCSYVGEWGGGVDHCDHYRLSCPQCGYAEEAEQTVSGPYHGDGLTTCPFCGRSHLEHNRDEETSRPQEPESPTLAGPPGNLPAAAQKVLQLLNQPTPRVDTGTDYAQPSTPFFTDVSAHSHGKVGVTVYHLLHFGTWLGDSDHWRHSTECFLPADWFFETLAKLRPGGETSSQGPAEIVRTDEAWGPDCAKPHCDVTREPVSIMMHLAMAADLKTVTLTLLRQEAGNFVPFTELRQTEIRPDTSAGKGAASTTEV